MEATFLCRFWLLEGVALNLSSFKINVTLFKKYDKVLEF